MINTIIWHLRGINTKGFKERLTMVKKMHQVSIIDILEPFADRIIVINFKIQLAMNNVVSNYYGIFCLFFQC